MDNEELNALREALAAEQHEIWSHWMRWQFKQGIVNADGSFTLPAVKVQRWARQMYTTYVNLSEQEKDSDREQADKVLKVLKEGSSDEHFVPAD